MFSHVYFHNFLACKNRKVFIFRMISKKKLFVTTCKKERNLVACLSQSSHLMLRNT